MKQNLSIFISLFIHSSFSLSIYLILKFNSQFQILTYFHICSRSFNKLIFSTSKYIYSITMRKSFHVDLNHHKIHVSYEPSHIQFDIFDKKHNSSQKAVFYDDTLPDLVKQECQYVSDLYEFLQGKSPQEIRIEEEEIKFNVVRIKKERWFSLKLQDRTRNTDKSYHSQQNPQKIPKNKRQQSLYLQIQKLKIQNQNLLVKNKDLQEQLKMKNMLDLNRLRQLQDNNTATLEYQDLGPYKKIKNGLRNQLFRNHGTGNGIKAFYSPNQTCRGFSQYHIYQHVVTKIGLSPAVLVFNEQVNHHEKKTFSVQLEKDFDNNWIILGLMAQQHINRPYCYCFKNSICFSGSLGLIFNELEALDVIVTPKKGDIISLTIYNDDKVQWKFNNQPIIQLTLSKSMHSQALYPYLMLSSPKDSVRININ